MLTEIQIGSRVNFNYDGKAVSGIVEDMKVVDGKKIAPENRGKTLIVVKRDDGSYRSYYLYKVEG